MQVEALSMRVWLLVVFVTWLVLVCVLELAGMGTYIKPLSPDQSLVPPLPPLPAKLAERLGPLTNYTAIAEHPAFAEDRKPHPFMLSGGNTQAAPITARLSGVILTPTLKMATLTVGQNTSIRLRQGGEAIQGWRLLSLEPRDATVEGPNGAQSLSLTVFDGKGGQPPTVLHRQPQESIQVDSAKDGHKTTAGGSAQVSAAKGISPVPVDTPYGPPTNEDQLRAIRERIEQRRQQLRLQQQLQLQHTINGASP